MLRDFNIIATTDRISENRAMSELWVLLRAVGDEKPIVDRVGIWGIIAAKTSLESIETVKKISEDFKKHPESIQTLYRIIPIQRLVPTDLSEIKKAIKELATPIGSNESFRITFEKRRTNLKTKDVIESVADLVERKVNLENPDWVILIESLGRLTGLSILHPKNILNIQKERASVTLKA